MAKLPAPPLYKQLIKGWVILGVPFEWFIFSFILWIWGGIVFFSLKNLLISTAAFFLMFFVGRYLTRKDPDFIKVWQVKALIVRSKKGKKGRTYYP